MTILQGLINDPNAPSPIYTDSPPSVPVLPSDVGLPCIMLADRDTHRTWWGLGPFQETNSTLEAMDSHINTWDIPRLVTVPFGLSPSISIITPRLWIKTDTPFPIHSESSSLLSATPRYHQSMDEWCAMVNKVQADMPTGYQKMVLARQLSYESIPTEMRMPLLDRLTTAESGVYRVLLSPSPNHGFLSLSPEHLFRRMNGTIELEALAGTRTHQQPIDCLNSEKNQQEHHAVSDWIREALTPFTNDIHISPSHPIQLRHVTHTKTHISIPHIPTSDATLIQALFPTPAVGGVPRVESVSYLLRVNQPTGTLYRGLVGLVCRDWSIWVVMIRYAEWHHHNWTLYGGAGIMPQSDATEEWNEIDAKWRLFRNTFETIQST